MSSRLRNLWVRLPLHRCLVLAGITLIACGRETDPTAPPAAPPPASPPPASPPPLGPPVGVAVSPSGLSLIVGGVERLTARAYDAADRTTISSFEWASADPAIATVDKSDGRVTAISTGTTTVTATVGALSATAPVSVIDIAGPIAFTRVTSSSAGSLTFDVLAFSLPDRAPRSLPRPGQFPSIGAPAWSPDGRLLAVEVVDTGFVLPGGEDGIDWTSDLYVLNAAAPATSSWRAMTANGRSRSPSWSPDGSRIVYVGPSTHANSNYIYVVDAGGGDPVRLTPTEGSYGTPRWSPDGTRVAFSDGRVGSSDVFIVRADGSELTNLTRNPAYDADPSWSPDGKRLAFVSDRDGIYRRVVFVVDADGGNLTRLTNDLFGGNSLSSGPVWSPDGRQIIFALTGGIYVMNADGSSPVRLTTPPADSWDYAPAWKR